MLPVLITTLEQNVRPDSVQLSHRRAVDVVYDSIEEEHKVQHPFLAKVEEVKTGSSEKSMTDGFRLHRNSSPFEKDIAGIFFPVETSLVMWLYVETPSS